MYEVRDTPGIAGQYDVLRDGEVIVTGMNSVDRQEFEKQIREFNARMREIERERMEVSGAYAHKNAGRAAERSMDAAVNDAKDRTISRLIGDLEKMESVRRENESLWQFNKLAFALAGSQSAVLLYLDWRVWLALSLFLFVASIFVMRKPKEGK